jgi:hypothetical protein
MSKVSIGKHLSRSTPSVIIATFCWGFIYADWNNTQKWKQNQQLQKQIIEEVKTQPIIKS